MDITLKDYIRNPSGSRARVVGETELVRNRYNDKFNKLLLKVAGKIDYFLYKDTSGRRYVVHFKIPSESIDNLFYDTVIEFETKDDVRIKSDNLDQYYIKFFSNDPNFVFTYANVFKNNNLLIKELKDKFGEIVFKQSPEVTNPYKMVGYVKSLYFAYLYYSLRGLDKKISWANAEKINWSNIKSGIMHSSRKIQQAQELKKITDNEKKLNKKILINKNDYDNIYKLKTLSKNSSNTVKMVNKTKRTSMVNKVKTVGKIGRKR